MLFRQSISQPCCPSNVFVKLVYDVLCLHFVSNFSHLPSQGFGDVKPQNQGRRCHYISQIHQHTWSNMQVDGHVTTHTSKKSTLSCVRKCKKKQVAVKDSWTWSSPPQTRKRSGPTMIDLDSPFPAKAARASRSNPPSISETFQMPAKSSNAPPQPVNALQNLGLPQDEDDDQQHRIRGRFRCRGL